MNPSEYDYSPRLRDDLPARLDKHYIFARYICPCCNKRYGDPDASLMMDVERCPDCPRLGMLAQ